MQIGAKRLAVAYTPIASTFLNAKRKLINFLDELKAPGFSLITTHF